MIQATLYHAHLCDIIVIHTHLHDISITYAAITINITISTIVTASDSRDQEEWHVDKYWNNSSHSYYL